jgi:hypothetical protein
MTGNIFKINYDLVNERQLNWQCRGYDYYLAGYQALAHMRFQDTSGWVVCDHFDDPDFWILCRFEKGLLEGTFVQNGKIESPSLRAQYHRGLLHGYRITECGGARYDMGRFCFDWRVGRRGHVYYCCTRGHQYYSKLLCFHCIAQRLKECARSRRYWRTVPFVLPLGLARIVAMYAAFLTPRTLNVHTVLAAPPLYEHTEQDAHDNLRCYLKGVPSGTRLDELHPETRKIIATAIRGMVSRRETTHVPEILRATIDLHDVDTLFAAL